MKLRIPTPRVGTVLQRSLVMLIVEMMEVVDSLTTNQLCPSPPCNHQPITRGSMSPPKPSDPALDNIMTIVTERHISKFLDTSAFNKLYHGEKNLRWKLIIGFRREPRRAPRQEEQEGRKGDASWLLYQILKMQGLLWVWDSAIQYQNKCDT